ncbi:hypothetical protein FHX46_000687 [Amycolatopsis viridis]|uniref:Uncharacterized protein n=1 Tax=Amycolatopsis viridis TaxID=185678 RepID=A0ABX0SQF4_9PSEU|nr:hypothetical protein [Amycolatopsis viridis]
MVRDFGKGSVGVEPVERLTGEHRVGAGTGQRSQFGRAVQDRHVWVVPAELGSDLRVRFHGGDPEAERAQSAGGLSGARAEIHHFGGPWWHRPVQRVERVVRTVLGLVRDAIGDLHGRYR